MRQDRYKIEEQKKKNRKIKRRKKILTVFVLLLIAGVAAECYILFGMTTVDKRFERSVGRGLSESWKQKTNDLTFQKKGMMKGISFIETEYEAVHQFRNHRFEDKELYELSEDYISALNACRRAAKRRDPLKDFDAFWELFSEPYGQRLKAIYKLYTGNYNLGIDKESMTAEKKATLAMGWLLCKLDEVKFKKTGGAEGNSAYGVEFRNDSEADIEYIDIAIELVDKDGNVLETVSAYTEKISRNGKAEMKFTCTAEKVAKYRITNATIKLR